MTDELNDEQVAFWAQIPTPYHDGGGDSLERIGPLAREVLALRALRPPCPTCKGKGEMWGRRIAPDLCSACAGSGLMPLPDYIAALKAERDVAKADAYEAGWLAYHEHYGSGALPKPGEPT